MYGIGGWDGWEHGGGAGCIERWIEETQCVELLDRKRMGMVYRWIIGTRLGRAELIDKRCVVLDEREVDGMDEKHGGAG